MKRRPRFFTGTVLILFAIYLLVLFVQSLTREHVSIYEVTEKNIADDDMVTGIVLRHESLVNTDKGGYINYYVGEGARIGHTTTVYSIDQTGQFAEQIAAFDEKDIKLSDDDTKEIRDDIANYRNSFDLSDYSKITNFQYSIDNTLLRMTTVNLLDKINKVMKSSGGSALKLIKAKNTGIISFYSDGMENLTINDINSDIFKNTNDNWTQLRSTQKVSAGSPVYKLVQGDDWSVIVPLTDEQYKKLSGKDYVKITFKKDGFKVNSPVTTFVTDGKYYAEFDFDKYMLRYLDNRYLDIQIEFKNTEGLKLPVSSILKKDFYKIPKEYVTQGGDEGGDGVMVRTYDKDGSELDTFTPIEAYECEDEDYIYVDALTFEQGATLVHDNALNRESMQLTKIEPLEGVYSCNNGYCQFKRIKKMYANDEYAIVENNTKQGLAVYDHIILNPKMIGENDIIY